MIDLAEQQVAQIPRVVAGQVERVGPAAVSRVDRGVGDGEGNLDLVADIARRGDHDMGDLQIGRRRGFDAHRLDGRCVVVVIEAELQHLAGVAIAPDPRRVGDNEDVVRPFQIARRCVAEAAAVSSRSAEAASVLDIAEVAILVQVEETVL